MITLRRRYYDTHTAGMIYLPSGGAIYTLELPWMDNAIGVSCIPEGEYIVDRDYTGRHKWFRFRDQEVHPRSAIEIHPATYLHHLQGCIAPAMRLHGDGEEVRTIQSREACERLLDWFEDDSFYLRITSNAN